MSLFWTDAGLKGTAGGRRLTRPVLVLMTDDSLADPLAAARKLPRGSWVILRFVNGCPLPVYALALRKLCRQRGLVFLASGDHRLAAKLGADGVHLPEAFARSACLAPLLGWIGNRSPRRWMSVAAHSGKALARAAQIGADAALLSPVLSTQSHPGAKPLGLIKFHSLCRVAKLPVIALGGVARQSARHLKYARIAGLAGVSMFEV